MKRRDAIYGIAAIVLALYVCPVFVLNSNSKELQHFEIGFTIWVLSGVTLLGVLVFLFASYVLARAKVPYLSIPIRAVFFFLVSTALFFPLVTRAGQVEIDQIALDADNLMISCALALLLLVATMTRLRMSVMIGSIAIVAVNAATQSYFLTTHFVPKDFDALYTASSERNVFVLSLDGVPRDIAIEALRQDPQLMAAFKDFTVFQNVVASSPGTFDSVMAEISGIANLKAKYPTGQALEKLLYAPNLIPNRLESDGYNVAAYGMYAAGLSDKARRLGIGTLSQHYTPRERLEQVAELYEYAIARMLSSRFVFSRKYVATISVALGVSDQLSGTQKEDIENQNRLDQRTRNHLGVKWDISDIETFLDFQIYLRDLRVGTNKPVAHFGHFLFTHYPVDFDSDCNYQSDVPNWFSSRQNREGLKDQTRCALRAYRLFIEKIKSLGIARLFHPRDLCFIQDP